MIRPALLLTGYLLFIASLWATAVYMPERLATHFGINGMANGFASKDTFILIMVVAGLLPIVMVTIGAFVPASMFNIPNRDYWIAPERVNDTRALVKQSMLSLAIIFIIFEAALVLTVLEANCTQPAQLDNAIFLPMIFFTMVGVLYQAFSSNRQFSRIS